MTMKETVAFPLKPKNKEAYSSASLCWWKTGGSKGKVNITPEFWIEQPNGRFSRLQRAFPVIETIYEIIFPDDNVFTGTVRSIAY